MEENNFSAEVSGDSNSLTTGDHSGRDKIAHNTAPVSTVGRDAQSVNIYGVGDRRSEEQHTVTDREFRQIEHLIVSVEDFGKQNYKQYYELKTEIEKLRYDFKLQITEMSERLHRLETFYQRIEKNELSTVHLSSAQLKTMLMFFVISCGIAFLFVYYVGSRGL